MLTERMHAHIAKREKATGPHQPDVHQPGGMAMAMSPSRARNKPTTRMYIGSPKAPKNCKPKTKRS